MEMLAANKKNLRRIFAAGWREGESDAGEGDNMSDNTCVWWGKEGGGGGPSLS